MRVLHVQVERSEGWFVAQALEEPGIITQGRTLDELVFMVRDAAELMLGDKSIQIELLLPSKLAVPKLRARRKRSLAKAG
jgi:predicted RNase H-like HicB family nuclease